MDYGKLLAQVFQEHGISPLIQFNAFASKTPDDRHWILTLPDVDFSPDTLLVIEFQDYVTMGDNGVYETEQVRQHYKDRADQVVVVHWTHGLGRYVYGGPHTLEFSAHNYRECTELLQRLPEWQQIAQSPKARAWQCLNGRICPHRIRVASILEQWSDGILTLGDERSLPGWPYSTYRGTENFDNFVRLSDVYGSCAVNVVTETQYDHAPGIITEKTFYAMAAGQIPIIIGHPGAVQDLQELGFDVFPDIVDTSYDRMPNGVRAEMALSLNRHLIEGHVDLAAVAHRLERQRQRVLSYPNIMSNRLRQDVTALLRIIF